RADFQYSADVDQHFRAADEFAGDGVGAGWRAARQAHLRHCFAAGRDPAGLDVPGIPGLRVHTLLPRRTDVADEPAGLVLLHSDGLPRRARHHRRDLADDPAGRAVARPHAAVTF